MLAASLRTLLQGSQVIRPVDLTEQEAVDINRLMKDGKLEAVMIIPSGYSARLLFDQPAALEVVIGRAQPASQTLQRKLDAVAARLMGAVEVGHISLETTDKQVALGYDARQEYLQAAISKAIAAGQQPPLTVEVVRAAGKTTSVTLPSRFLQASPGMRVQFATFGIITSSMVSVIERKSGTLSPREKS